VEGLRSYIDARMAQGVLDKLEDEVLNGDGTAGHMLGILATPGLTPPVAAAAGTPFAAAIAAQRAAIYTASRLRPDAVVMSPATWVTVSMETTTGGGFLGGTSVMANGLVSQVAGLRVVESPHIADGTALLGAFKQGGQLWRKGGVTVQASNSHQDFFIKNMTAIRAEIRAALTVYRPAAFGTVTGLAPATP
jgi:HK97 family phage major capsid protein